MNIIFHRAISNVRVYPKSENWDLNWHHKVVYNYKRKIGRKFLFFPIYEIHDKGVVEEGAFSDNKFYTMEEVSKWKKTYIENDKFYLKPHCTIFYGHKGSQDIFFETVEELNKYVDDIKNHGTHIIIE